MVVRGCSALVRFWFVRCPKARSSSQMRQAFPRAIGRSTPRCPFWPNTRNSSRSAGSAESCPRSSPISIQDTLNMALRSSAKRALLEDLLEEANSCSGSRVPSIGRFSDFASSTAAPSRFCSGWQPLFNDHTHSVADHWSAGRGLFLGMEPPMLYGFIGSGSEVVKFQSDDYLKPKELTVLALPHRD